MKKVNLHFIGLLIFISLFQPFSFAPSPITPGLSKQSSGTILYSSLKKPSAEHHQSQISLIVEFEEDEVQNEHVYSRSSISSHFNFNSNHYSLLLNTLYLSLAFANLSKVELPLFVRYHSWKSHLS
jgi:hypothetical protein